MRVCCVSDLHGRLPVIPECDVLVIAGDLCPDIERVGWDAGLMARGQLDWLETAYSKWERTVPARHIFYTPGNHDWIVTLPDTLRTRMFVDEGVEVSTVGSGSAWALGDAPIDQKPAVRFWFTPWVNYCGHWNWQMMAFDRAKKFEEVPYILPIDLLVSHSPPYDCVDKTYSGEPVGCRALRDVIQRRQPRYSVFGHIHEGQRYGREGRVGGTKCFNVAMWGPKWEPLVLDI